MSAAISNERPNPDKVLVDIVDYVQSYEIDSALAYETARNCLIDTLGCGLEALEYPACTKFIGSDHSRDGRSQRREGTRDAVPVGPRCRRRSTSER